MFWFFLIVSFFQDLLPRGQNPNSLRERNKAVNKIVRTKVQGWPRVEVVAADKGLVQPDGTISHLDMPDYLHLSDSGYRKAFHELHELLIQLLSEGEEEKDLTPSEWIFVNYFYLLFIKLFFYQKFKNMFIEYSKKVFPLGG